MKNKTIILLLTATLLNTTGFASKLFVSNNTGIISSAQAYEKMHNSSQNELNSETLSILQHYHFEMGTLQNALGAYYMQSSEQMTADNTLVFTTSKEDYVKNKTMIKTAAKLAKNLSQESVAIFIDDDHGSNIDVTVTFSEDQPTYADLQQYLPILEENNLVAFSIYFAGESADLDNTHVSAIEWLTTPDKLTALQDLFPNANISSKTGEADLVYQDRHYIQIG